MQDPEAQNQLRLLHQVSASSEPVSGGAGPSSEKTAPIVSTPAERDAAEESELRQLWDRVDLDSSGLLDHREVRGSVASRLMQSCEGLYV